MNATEPRLSRDQQTWVAAAILAALTVLLTYPISRHPGSTSLAADADVHTFTWTLAWDVHALLTRPWAIFDANIFFPYARTLAFSENLIGSVPFAAPAIWLTGNPVAAMNVVSLTSCFLCGLGVYVLGRRLGLSHAAALVGGIVFAFSPARFFRFAQIHLTTIQWIPFCLAALIAYLRDGRRADLLWALGLFSLQVLASGHGAVYLLVAVVLVLAWHSLATRTLALATRLRDVGVIGVLLLVPTVAILPPYLAVQREHGLRRTLENWETAPASFIASPTRLHTWMQETLGDPRINERASAFLFPGYLPIVLAALGLALRGPWRRATPPPWLWGIIAILGTLLAAGPPIGLWPLVYWMPGLNFIRIPSRFFLLAMVGIAVLAAVGYDRVVRGWTRRSRTIAAWVVVGILVSEFNIAPLPASPYHVEFPAVDRWLATQAAPFSVAEVPVRPSVRVHSTYMLHAMAHWQPTIHGHSSLLTPLHERLYDELRTFPDDRSIASLIAIGVRYIVVHVPDYAPEEWVRIEPLLAARAGQLALVHEDESGRVYALTASQ